MTMIECHICAAQFQNNRGGQFTTHLGEEHRLSLEEYTVKFTLDGYEPRCVCGLCDQRPHFRRGKFSRYALNHDRFDVRERLYREKFGDPMCKVCGAPVTFHRGVPNKYCSDVCNGKNAGFSLSKTQEKIQEVVKERHGVTNAFQIKEVAADNLERCRSEENRIAKSELLRALWRTDTFRSSQRTLFQLSGLHRKIRSRLNLEELGFKSEQRIDRYLVDELQPVKRVVVEVFGNFPHANPLLYSSETIVRLRHQKPYTAHEKWESDRRKIDRLTELGYKVIVVWESDDIEKKRIEILGSLGTESVT